MMKSLSKNHPIVVAILEENPNQLLYILSQEEPFQENHHQNNNNNNNNIFNLNTTVHPTSQTPLLMAIGPNHVHTTMVNILLKYGSDIEMGDIFHSTTPLHAACLVNNVNIVKILLTTTTPISANPNAQSADGKTALMHMAKIGNVPMIQVLIEMGGANPYVYCEQAKNALMYACSENQVEVVRYLLHRFDQVNHYKVDTPLWYACASGHVEVVKVLLENGAQMEYRQDSTIYSTTPLMEACEWGHTDVVHLLLQTGAEPRSKAGRKALLLAKKAGNFPVVALMESWQRRLNETEEYLKATMDDDKDNRRMALLPTIMEKIGKRPDLVQRLLRHKMKL